MAGLGDTTAALRRLRAGMAEAKVQSSGGPIRLTETVGFGSNPGDLRMFSYAPEEVEGAALVVVLHGCTQTAEAYQHGAGWATLAERHGFAILCPEQKPSNNPNRCFNWFEPGDTRRDAGEAASIRQMIDHMAAAHRIDPERIYVTGLSAGGAMTAVMLAAYPEVFAGGAIIAGLPYGAASNMPEAFGSMMQPRSRPGHEWGELVRRASPGGAWPTVSVWHGDADTTVAAANAEEIVKQWRDVHGLDQRPPIEASLDNGHRRHVWIDDDGRPVVASYTLTGMGHGAPLATQGPHGCGAPGPFLLEVGLSSSLQIATDWGLITACAEVVEMRPPQQPAAEPAPVHQGPADVEAVIRNALSAAGLIR